LDSDGNQLPPAGETACPTYFAKRLIQHGGAGGFACRSNGHNQRSASMMNKSRKRLSTRLRAELQSPAGNLASAIMIGIQQAHMTPLTTRGV